MEENKSTNINGFSIASMILGIVAIVTLWLWFVSGICAILALVFGIIGIRKSGKGMALSGIITGSIALLIVAFIVNGSIIGQFMNRSDRNYKRSNNKYGNSSSYYSSTYRYY